MLGLCFYIILLVFLYHIFPSTDVTLMAGMFILAGMANGSYQQIPWAMYPDLMDLTRNKSGEAIEGTFSAIWLFGQKVANALAPLALSLILGFYGWQETSKGMVKQTETAIQALQFTVTLIPACVLILATMVLQFLYRPSAKKALEGVP